MKQTLSRTLELKDSIETARQHLDRQLNSSLHTETRLTEKLVSAHDEITRSLSTISALQSEAEANKASLQRKSEVIRRQEDVVTDLRRQVLTITDELSQSKAESKSHQQKSSSLQDQLNESLRLVTEQSEEMVRNQQVITYLNDQQNIFEMGNTARVSPGAGIDWGSIVRDQANSPFATHSYSHSQNMQNAHSPTSRVGHNPNQMLSASSFPMNNNNNNVSKSAIDSPQSITHLMSPLLIAINNKHNAHKLPEDETRWSQLQSQEQAKWDGSDYAAMTATTTTPLPSSQTQSHSRTLNNSGGGGGGGGITATRSHQGEQQQQHSQSQSQSQGGTRRDITRSVTGSGGGGSGGGGGYYDGLHVPVSLSQSQSSPSLPTRSRDRPRANNHTTPGISNGGSSSSSSNSPATYQPLYPKARGGVSSVPLYSWQLDDFAELSGQSGGSAD